ncbi:ComF family protein [Clostridium sp. AL.422]|uniref:ComF family protein n=1 Tax=Clostridium TaxID=1485 RepID=UPI00293DAD46|nr:MULTISPECIES: ComF family protein [unclassified Clostridium]MDV4151611.1 ComF family protein [Clostridium sp. AL.422]
MGKGIVKLLISLKDELLDIIYPPKNNCIICESEFVGVCPICKSRIKRVKEKDNILSYGYYNGVLKKLILEFKYNKNFVAGSILAEFLCEIIIDNNMDIDYIVFIPSSKSAIKNRGFNQCEYLANELKKHLDINICSDVIKNNNIKEQKLLSREDRFKNIKDAFSLKTDKKIKNKKLLLIDDVMTTGATLYECEKLLKANGAVSIKLLTVAKSYI